MQLVYTATGKPVTVGDIVTLRDGEKAQVVYFRPPHSANSSGKVTVQFSDDNFDTFEYYVSVIGAKWIARDDRDSGVNITLTGNQMILLEKGLELLVKSKRYPFDKVTAHELLSALQRSKHVTLENVRG